MGKTTGQCLCGTVRFAVDSVDERFHACQCGMCHRWAGGPFFAANVTGFALRSPADDVGIYASSDWADRAFCRRCGTSLYYRLKPADLYLVNVGCFDDQAAFTLADEIFVDSACAAPALSGDHERLTETETLARFGATPG